MRYRCLLSRLSSVCSCGARCDLQHHLSYEKGGFVKKRHNKLRNTTAQLLTLLCNDVRAETRIQTFSRRKLSKQSHKYAACDKWRTSRTYVRTHAKETNSFTDVRGK